MGGPGKHVRNSGKAICWLWLVSKEVRYPLHRCGIPAHRRLTDNVWIPGHAGEPVAALAENHSITLRICIDDSRGLGNIIRSRGHCPSYFFLCRDRKSTRLNSSHTVISYAVFCLKKKKVLQLDD